MKDQTLKDVSDKLVQVGEFLEELVKHPVRVECLRQFVECKHIVEWLREETNGQLLFMRFLTVNNAVKTFFLQMQMKSKSLSL